MTDFLILLLSLSLSGSFLVILLSVSRPVLGKAFSGTWMYYIWAIVALRMLLPITPEQGLLNHVIRSSGQPRQEQSLSGSTDLQAGEQAGNTSPQADGQAAVPSSPVREETPAAAFPDASPQDTAAAQNSRFHSDQEGVSKVRTDTGDPSFVSSFPAGTADSLPAVLATLWLVTAVFLFLRTAAASRTFLRKVCSRAIPVDSPVINSCYESACARLAVRRPPRLLVSPDAGSPMLTGLLRPAIVLPADTLQRSGDLSYIFLHELTHYKRKDIWYKWLFQLVKCIHFFNPFSYLLLRQVERCCELSCDEAVVRDMTLQERKAYGLTLLDALEPGALSPSSAASASLCENAVFIKERLVTIKMTKKKSGIIKIITPLLTAGLCFGAFYLGAYAAPGDASLPGDTTPVPSPKQNTAAGAHTTAAIPLSSQTPSSGKTAGSYADTDAPDGFTLLKTETVSLSSIRDLKLLLSYEEVTLYPSADNTLTMLFYGNNSFTYAADEIAVLRQDAGTVTLESGKYNPAWSKLFSNKWQPKIYLYVPAAVAGTLQVEIGSGSLKSTTNLQAASASFETASGKMTLMDVSAKDRLSLINHSGSTQAGSLSGGQCILDNASGKLTVNTIISQKGSAIANSSGKVTAGDVTAPLASAENQSGNLSLNNLNISGSLQLSTVSGPVSAGQLTAKDYTVSTGSGSMEIQSLTGNGSLSCGSGHIRSDTLVLTGSLTMDTRSGSIQISVPENTAMDVTIASVGSGSIHTFFPVPDYKKADGPVSSRYGTAPFHSVTVSAASGSITIDKK